MTVSILHRITGDGMGIIGAMLLVWWLSAISGGGQAYANFLYYVWQADAGDMAGLIANVAARIVLVGLTWAFFQHMLSGIRHFVLDMGAGYELRTNRYWSMVIMGLSVVMTIVLWAWLLFGKAS